MSQDRKSKQEKGMSISLTSQITGIEVHTLRYWEKEFAEYLSPIRTDGGQRRYRAEDLQVVLELKRLLRDEMFSIAGARKFLAKHLSSKAA